MNEKWLSAHLRSQWRRIKLRSFESALSFSVPDLHAIVGKGKACWIELKVCESVHCAIPFRKGQVQWIERYEADGGIVYLITMTKFKGKRELFVARCDAIRSWSSRKLADVPAIFSGEVQLAGARLAETAILNDFQAQIRSAVRYRRSGGQ